MKRRYPLLLICLSSLACATGSTEEVLGIPSESRAAIHMGKAGGPDVAVRESGADTVVTIDGSRFLCRGHRGYLGQVSAGRGWISVGKITFRYDRGAITLRGRSNWARFKAGSRVNLIVQQDGRTSRSVFRN